MNAVEVRDLVKEFPAPDGGVLRAVDGISFSVDEGEIFGFLGPNGAGKTTSLEIMEGLQSPTSGSAHVLGLNATTRSEEMKKRIGIQLQAGAYFDYLRLREILELFASFYPKSIPADDLLRRVGLTDKADALVRQLSGGLAQRFSIVASIVNDPEVVFLDEATTGLDPRARREVWDLIRDIRASGKTVVLTTHYMEEAQVLCDRVAIIDHGNIVALDTPTRLIQSLESTYRIVFEAKDAFDLASLERLGSLARAGDGFELRVRKPTESLPEFLGWAARNGVELLDLQVLPATLEDVFLSHTGRTIEQEEAGS